ncbi:hypothetical protein GB927_018280 [Shinella sp. CPCC 100929]|uniref:Uncharacterized protein n=2 Tax=Shinella lacus TaxID=2654216 RepID=A0ABT1R9Y5_9HYPH|nr:hypothetical protein [Shinella lacus]
MKRAAVLIRAATGNHVNVVFGFSRSLLHGVHALFAFDGVNDRTTLQEFPSHALLPRLFFCLRQNDSTKERLQWADIGLFIGQGRTNSGHCIGNYMRYRSTSRTLQIDI